jgi:hypothetical protein
MNPGELAGGDIINTGVDANPHQYALITSFGQNEPGHGSRRQQNDVLIRIGSGMVLVLIRLPDVRTSQYPLLQQSS